ncbi:MAG: pilus assembly protein TadG-related protein [Candidatus Dormibacteraeota bacterium]|nr:pilus assembly protein TadG-related protein [Candidatus Dormibacteraeota bacterium]
MLARFSAWVERAASRSCDRGATEQRGQVAVLFAIAAVALVVTAGLALDAGQSFVSQRALQAGADTAAQSGTSMLDADFTACVNSQALPYTAFDISGVVTKIVSDAAAAQGGATSPPVATFVAYSSSSPPALTSLGPVSSYTGQLCAPDGVWGGPTGVKVATTETRPTFVLQLLGIRTTTEDASGTAVFGYVGGGGAPFASWDAACYHSSSGQPLADGDTVVLLSPQWYKYTCGFGTPASFKGYIDPISPITLPLPPGACIQTGPGVGIKTPPTLQVGQTYLIPEISSYTKGYCPGYSSSNAGPYMLTYAGMLAVTVTSETTTTILAVVTDTSPTTSGVTICPIGDSSCSSSFVPTSPTGVELYQ